MERGQAYVRAANAIAGLAEDHHRALGRYMAFIVAGLRGPAADRLLDTAHVQQAQVVRAFLTAWDAAGNAARREDAEPGPQPMLRPPPMRGGGGGAGRRGVDVGVLREAIREARVAGTRLCDAGRGLTSILSRAGLDPAPGYTVQEVGDWLLGQQYEVKRRLALAEAAEAAVADAFAGLGPAAGSLDGRLESLTPDELAAMVALREALQLPARRQRTDKVAEWWAALSPAMRTRLTETFPRTIGALDGLPAAARHDANTRVLNADLRRYQSELAALPTAGPDGGPINVIARDDLEKKIEVLGDIQD
ncbi:MAG: hypothetical protein GEV11_30035, partial [Streptosporangiales bacterium]|nr:hypothetical protein [Streptosporangiales bacterium]